MMDLLDRLLEHDQWTTTKYLNICRDLTETQLDQEFDIGHRTVRATLDHMIYAVDLWTSLMQGQSPSEPRDDLSLTRLIERHERCYSAFAALARKLRDEQRLDEIFIDHHDIPQSTGSTIIQVPLHNHQHRSELLHIFHRLGVPDLRFDGDPQEWEHLTGRIKAATAQA